MVQASDQLVLARIETSFRKYMEEYCKTYCGKSLFEIVRDNFSGIETQHIEHVKMLLFLIPEYRKFAKENLSDYYIFGASVCLLCCSNFSNSYKLISGLRNFCREIISPPEAPYIITSKYMSLGTLASKMVESLKPIFYMFLRKCEMQNIFATTL